jgi:hypothetical protein
MAREEKPVLGVISRQREADPGYPKFIANVSTSPTSSRLATLCTQRFPVFDKRWNIQSIIFDYE